MHLLWSNTISNKIFDINYINNTLNYNFFNKYIIHEIWLQNFNKLILKYNTHKYAHNYYALNKIFWSFIIYMNTIKFYKYKLLYFNININNIFINFNNKIKFKR